MLKFFYVSKAKSFVSDINSQCFSNSIKKLTSVIEQISVFMFIGAGDSIQTVNDFLGRIKFARFLFGERFHQYMGHTLTIQGIMDGNEGVYRIWIGKAAQAKIQLRVGDEICGSPYKKSWVVWNNCRESVQKDQSFG